MKRGIRLLTQKQQETLDFVKSYINKHKKSPTLEEMSSAFGVSVSAIADRLGALKKKGFLMKSPHGWRNLDLMRLEQSPMDRIVNIPVVASVGADNLSVFAEENITRYLHIQESLLKGHRDVFGLFVRGNSMRDAGIRNGDYILVEDLEHSEIHDGDRIVATIGDMITLKKIQRTNNKIVLHPENSSGEYSPIVIEEGREDFQILGRFIDVIPFAEPDEGFTYEPLN